MLNTIELDGRSFTTKSASSAYEYAIASGEFAKDVRRKTQKVIETTTRLLNETNPYPSDDSMAAIWNNTRVLHLPGLTKQLKRANAELADIAEMDDMDVVWLKVSWHGSKAHAEKAGRRIGLGSTVRVRMVAVTVTDR